MQDDVVEQPNEPGSFKGDIWFGHPEKRTLGTHRWNGNRWEELPSELDGCLSLLAKARLERDEARSAYAALTQTLIDSERREKEAIATILSLREQLEKAEREVKRLESLASDHFRNSRRLAERVATLQQIKGTPA